MEKLKQVIEKVKEQADIRNVLGVVLLILGLYLLLKPVYINYIYTPKKLDNSYNEALALSQEELEANRKKLEQNEEDMFDFSQVKSITELEPNTTINKANVIGGLYIPKVNIKMPIMYGATHENMLNGVGTLKPNMEMGIGNFSLAGHNHPNPNLMLAPLKKMKDGFEMYITDKQHIYKYQTDSIEVVMPERIDVLDEVEGRNELTLVSCYSDDGHDRIIVKGELLEVIPYEEASQELLKAFNDL